MIKFPKKKTNISIEVITNTIWISVFLALILSIPPLCIFLGIYFLMGNLIVGAIVGFGVHFIILAFSNKISKFLTNIMS